MQFYHTPREDRDSTEPKARRADFGSAGPRLGRVAFGRAGLQVPHFLAELWAGCV
jgi:hypothetical protein